MGIITLIFPATDATDRPCLCEVNPITLNTEMNKNPKIKTPVIQGALRCPCMVTSPEWVKYPTLAAVK